jgi:hypothetical protein
MLSEAKAAASLDTDTLAAFGREFPIPPFAVINQLFPTVPHVQFRKLLWPLVDPSVVDPDWYAGGHPDVGRGVASGAITDVGDHYRRAGYFERKTPRRIDPLYG